MAGKVTLVVATLHHSAAGELRYFKEHPSMVFLLHGTGLTCSPTHIHAHTLHSFMTGANNCLPTLNDSASLCFNLFAGLWCVLTFLRHNVRLFPVITQNIFVRPTECSF